MLCHLSGARTPGTSPATDSARLRRLLQVGLLVIDEIHLLGADRGPILEVIVSRMRYIAAQVGGPGWACREAGGLDCSGLECQAKHPSCSLLPFLLLLPVGPVAPPLIPPLNLQHPHPCSLLCRPSGPSVLWDYPPP